MRSAVRSALIASLALGLSACGEQAPAKRPSAPAVHPAAPPPIQGAPAAAPGAPPLTATTPAASPPEVKAVSDSLEACHARLERFVQACVSGAGASEDARDLVLRDPRAWFAATFGAEHPRLAAAVAAYETLVKDIEELPAAVRAEVAAGQSEQLVERFVHYADPHATGIQSLVMREMRTPTVLYSLRLLAPGEAAGWHLGSFAHVDGTFRFVGPLEAILADETRSALETYGPLRIEEARRLRPDWLKDD